MSRSSSRPPRACERSGGAPGSGSARAGVKACRSWSFVDIVKVHVHARTRITGRSVRPLADRRRFVPLPTACEGGRFRGLRAAASLKRRSMERRAHRAAAFPRPQGRGLIEAWRSMAPDSVDAWFPRPQGRGLIEATRISSVDGHESHRFRGLRAAASLKHDEIVPASPCARRVSAASGPRPH